MNPPAATLRWAHSNRIQRHMARRLLSLAFVLLALFAGTQATQPAFALNLGLNAVEYLKQKTLDAILPKLQNLHLPDVSGQPSVPILGKINFQLSSIVLQSFTVNACNATFEAPEGVGVTVSDLSIHLTLDWAYQKHGFPWIPFGDGSADISITSSNMNLMLTMTEAVDGHMQIASSAAEVQVGHMDIKIHGSILSWIYDLLFDLFKGTIKKDIDSSIDRVLQTSFVQAINRALNKVPTHIPMLKNSVTFFNPLTAAPLVTKVFLQMETQAEFQLTAAPGAHCPVPRHVLPSSPPDRMVQVLVESYFVDSLFWTLQKLDLISLTITNAMLPKGSSWQLNTTALQYLFPGMYQKYPNMLLEIVIDTSVQPMLDIRTTGSSIALDTQTTVYAINSTLLHAFTLQMDLGADLIPSTDGTRLYGKLDSLTCNASLIESDVGPMDVSGINSLIGFLCPYVVMPTLNNKLAHGIPLPSLSPLMHLKHAELQSGDGFLLIGADLEIDLPPAL